MKKLLIIIITIIIILVLSAFYLVMGLQQSLFQQNYYENLLAETNVISQFHERIREELPNMMQEEEGDEISDQQLEVFDIIFEVYDEEWLEETFLQFTDQALLILDEKSDDMIITINIDDRRDQLKEAMVDHFLEKSDDELAELDINRAEITEKTDEILTEIEFFEEPIVIDLSEEEGLGDLVQYKNSFYQMFLIGFILALIILLAITFFIMKKAIVKYFGLVLSLYSLFFIINILVVKTVVIPNISTEVANEYLSENMFESLVNITLDQFLLVPIIAFVIGLILVIVGYKIAPKKAYDEDDFNRPDEQTTEKLNKVYEQKIEKDYQKIQKQAKEQEEKPEQEDLEKEENN